MQIDLIASTILEEPRMYGYTIEQYMEMDKYANDADQLAEFAGRACYQSWSKPNPNTRENGDYLANILNLGHESVLEHSSATFYVQGISRALTHELIRHRHLSFSQLSQRFVNGSDAEVVIPPAYRINFEEDSGRVMDHKSLAQERIYDHFSYSCDTYRSLEIVGEKLGLSRKENREAARSVMPNATETKIEVTGNLRAWRDVLKKRWSVHADAEIREFAGEILGYLRGIASNSVQDIPETPQGSDEQ